MQPEFLDKESKFPEFYNTSLDIDISHNKMINSQKNNYVNVSVAVVYISIMVNIKDTRLTFIGKLQMTTSKTKCGLSKCGIPHLVNFLTCMW